jgi:hypothetical protein
LFDYLAMKKIALEEHFWTDGFPHTGKLGADLFSWVPARDRRAFWEFRSWSRTRRGDRHLGAVADLARRRKRDPAKAASEAKAPTTSAARLRNTDTLLLASTCRCRSPAARGARRRVRKLASRAR